MMKMMMMMMMKMKMMIVLRYERQICRGRAAAARGVLGWTESHFVASKVNFSLFFICLSVFFMLTACLSVC